MACKSSGQECDLRWYDLALIVVGLPALALIVWLFRRRAEKGAQPVVRIEISVPPEPADVAPSVAEPEPVAPDDLRRIEGIGPKMSSVLQTAGITTFTQLAAAEEDQLRQILREAGVRVVNPSTWPEQAGLAAAGEWSDLASLQATLKGGRRA